MINHYNSNDWALSYWKWQINQIMKPSVNCHFSPPIWEPPANTVSRFWEAPSTLLDFPDDRFEIFSYAAESRAYAAGAQGLTGGNFNIAESVNLNDTTFNFGSAHKGHSAQFRSNIQKRWVYWTKALEDMSIVPNSP